MWSPSERSVCLCECVWLCMGVRSLSTCAYNHVHHIRCVRACVLQLVLGGVGTVIGVGKIAVYDTQRWLPGVKKWFE